MSSDDETDYSLAIPTPNSSLSDSPISISTPLSILSIPPPLTSAIDTARTLLSAATTSSDFTFQYSLISRSLAIGQSIAEQIVNPLSVFRPGKDAIAHAREVLLFGHTAMVQLLCRDSYFSYRDQIHQHLREIIQIQGNDLICMDDPRVKLAFHAVKDTVDTSGLSVSQRIVEWKRLAYTISLPDGEHFIALRFWSLMSVLRMEMDNVEKALAQGEYEEVRLAVAAQQEVADRFTQCMLRMDDCDQDKIQQVFTARRPKEWDRELCSYRKVGQNTLSRFHRVRLTVETQTLLRQGDMLLGLATDRTRETDIEYFKFQAILALDMYRAAYHVCVGFEDVNVELEGLCLWSMGRVMGRYLGLEEHAHHLYLQGVAMVAQVTALVPSSEWYGDSVAQIQRYRRKMETEERRTRDAERANVLGRLTIELMELRSRAAIVGDNDSLREFFGWLLRTFPPRRVKDKDGVRGILEAREICKVVLNVIALYDDRECEDELWVVFCEEVVKVLSSHWRQLLITDCQSLLWELGGCLLLSIIFGVCIINIAGDRWIARHTLVRAYGFEEGSANC